MRVTVLLFAALAEQCGRRELAMELPSGASAGAVWEAMRREHPAWGEVGKAVLLAVNGEFQPAEAPLSDGDTVALLPPMSGGAPASVPERAVIVTGLVRTPLPAAPAWADTGIGAIVRFDGVARDHTPAAPGQRVLRLKYEAYEPMAAARLAEIADEAVERWALRAIEIVHRLGTVPVGEASVRVVVAAPRRVAAFEACRFAIETLKASVPIWKKEFFEDGSQWVDGNFPGAPAATRGAHKG